MANISRAFQAYKESNGQKNEEDGEEELTVSMVHDDPADVDPTEMCQIKQELQGDETPIPDEWKETIEKDQQRQMGLSQKPFSDAYLSSMKDTTEIKFQKVNHQNPDGLLNKFLSSQGGK